MRARAAAVAAVASLLLIAGILIAVAAQRERHPVGGNWVRPVAEVAEVGAGERVCQPVARVPAGTGAIGLRIATSGRPGPELALTISAPGQSPVRGTLPAGWRPGDVVVPVPELGADRRDARVCVEHAGPGEIALAGGPGIGDRAVVDGAEAGGMIRLEFAEAAPRSWFPLAPDIADRLGVARDAFPGAAALPLFALLMLGVLGGSLLLVLREGRR